MSLRKAIDDKCRECIYDPVSGGGNWRQQVTQCTSYSCPLYSVRPLTKSRCNPRKEAKSVPEAV